MTILEMIAEWRKGCSNTEGVEGVGPEACQECTLALINAIEKKLTFGIPVKLPPFATGGMIGADGKPLK